MGVVIPVPQCRHREGHGAGSEGQNVRGAHQAPLGADREGLLVVPRRVLLTPAKLRLRITLGLRIGSGRAGLRRQGARAHISGLRVRRGARGRQRVPPL